MADTLNSNEPLGHIFMAKSKESPKNNLASIFSEKLKEIDDLFEIPTTVSETCLGVINKLSSDINNFPLLKNKVENLGRVITISKESITAIQKKSEENLSPQALVLLIGIVESLVKEIFDNLVRNNLEKTQDLEKYSLSAKELIELCLDPEKVKEVFIDLILSKIHGEKNPDVKVYFQNIQTIEGKFKTFFDIDLQLGSDLRKQVHKWFQSRHIIVHNASKIESKFVHNLAQLQIAHKYKVEEKLMISKEDYEQAKKDFAAFFLAIGKAIRDSSLELKL
jgi:hypothetical protein